MEAEANTAEASDSRPTETPRKPNNSKQGVNGSASGGAQRDQEKDADADVADEMSKAKIEDDTAPSAGA